MWKNEERFFGRKRNKRRANDAIGKFVARWQIKFPLNCQAASSNNKNNNNNKNYNKL